MANSIKIKKITKFNYVKVTDKQIFNLVKKMTPAIKELAKS